MKLSGVLFFLGLALILLSACSETESGNAGLPSLPPPSAAAKPATPVVVPVSKFIVPGSAEITAEKAQQFADASSALLLLGQQWGERLEKANDTEKIQILAAYSQAREQICAKMGLAGMDEFHWIQTKALPFPGNKAIFAQAGIKVP